MPNKPLALDLSDLDALALNLEVDHLELTDRSQVPQWYRDALEGDGPTEGILLTTGDLKRGVLEYNTGRTAITVNDGKPIPARVKQVVAIICGAWATQPDRRTRGIPFRVRNVARLLFDGKTSGNYQGEAKRTLADAAWLRFRFDNPDGAGAAMTFGKVRWNRNGHGVFTIEEEIHRLLLDHRYQSIPIQLASLPRNRFDLWNEALLQPRTALIAQVGQWQDSSIGPDETITLERLGLAGFQKHPGELRARLERMASEGNERQPEWHIAILDRANGKGLKARLTRLSLPVRTDAGLVRTDAGLVRTDAAIEHEIGPVDGSLDGLSDDCRSENFSERMAGRSEADQVWDHLQGLWGGEPNGRQRREVTDIADQISWSWVLSTLQGKPQGAKALPYLREQARDYEPPPDPAAPFRNEFARLFASGRMTDPETARLFAHYQARGWLDSDLAELRAR